MIGPLPPSSSDKPFEGSAADEFEQRAKRMKDKLLNKAENLLLLTICRIYRFMKFWSSMLATKKMYLLS